MLALGAVVHDAASIALLIIGGCWALVGVFALIQGRSTAREVRLEQGVVTFVLAFSPARTWWCPPPRLRNFEEAGVT
jgi:hydrogenase/urease accessory protein HupE